MIGVIAVLAPVRFDDDPTVHTGEIRDTAPDGLLSAELEAAKLPIAKTRPQPTLGIGRLPPEPAGMRIGFADRRHPR